MSEPGATRGFSVQSNTDPAGNVDLPLASIRAVYPALGDAGFRALVEDFYGRVEADEPLRRVFPDNLTDGREHQFLFLTQYFGGPNRYSQQVGPPMLRMRHMPFEIDRAARDLWLKHMLEAIEATAVPEPHASTLRLYFTQFSLHMIVR